MVRNAEHDLPEKEGSGLVMFTEGHWKGFTQDPGFRLAWMPLNSVEGPRLQDTLYYAGPGPDGEKTWSENADEAFTLFKHLPSYYTSVSTAWLDGPKCWILLYSKATDSDHESGLDGYKRPALARISRNLTDWSEPITLFDPAAQGAYGKFMHWPVGSHPDGHPDSEFQGDNLHLEIPPLPIPIDIAHPELGREDKPGWAYGAFILNRFTEWDQANRILKIYYLLSTGRPYQVQLMNTWLRIPDEVIHRSSTGYLKLFHGGNGTTPIDSGLPMQGIFYGVAENGNLIWNRYNGRGEQEDNAVSVLNWHSNSGNPIGRGFDHMLHVFGCGDGVVMAVHPNGNLHWYSYSGNGESDETGTLGWHPNSGNVIGNGWQNFLQIFVSPQEGQSSTSRIQIFAVAQNGDLYWYSYSGNGEWDPSGVLGWHLNSGNRVGNGWQNMKHIHGSGNVFFAVPENGDLLWYSYSGHGEDDVSGTLGWHPNSGNPVGNGWQNMKHIFGGVTEFGDWSHVVYAVAQNGDLFWYRYSGQGESDITGFQGWEPNSGNRIGTNW